jgi:hypothetical protein
VVLRAQQFVVPLRSTALAGPLEPSC